MKNKYNIMKIILNLKKMNLGDQKFCPLLEGFFWHLILFSVKRLKNQANGQPFLNILLIKQLFLQIFTQKILKL